MAKITSGAEQHKDSTKYVSNASSIALFLGPGIRRRDVQALKGVDIFIHLLYVNLTHNIIGCWNEIEESYNVKNIDKENKEEKWFSTKICPAFVIWWSTEKFTVKWIRGAPKKSLGLICSLINVFSTRTAIFEQNRLQVIKRLIQRRKMTGSIAAWFWLASPCLREKRASLQQSASTSTELSTSDKDWGKHYFFYALDCFETIVNWPMTAHPLVRLRSWQATTLPYFILHSFYFKTADANHGRGDIETGRELS